MSPDDEFFRREWSRLGAGVEVLVRTGEVGDVSGAQLDDGSDMGPHLVLSAYGIIIFTQSTERARFLIRFACAASQTHPSD